MIGVVDVDVMADVNVESLDTPRLGTVVRLKGSLAGARLKRHVACENEVEAWISAAYQALTSTSVSWNV